MQNPIHRKSYPSRATNLLALLLATLPLHSLADANDTFQLNAAATEQYDSNLFRLSSDVDAEMAIGSSTKSDRISILSAGLKLNKPYSLQRIELEATAINYRYQNFDYLDFTAANYAAAWRWKLTPDLHGNLTASQNESLNSFADYKSYRNLNIRTDNDLRFDAIYEIDGAWQAHGAVSRSKRTNSKIFVQEGDTLSNTIDGGIRYAFPSGSSLTYSLKTGQGEYINRPQPIAVALLDNRFDTLENEARLVWPITGKTTIDARAAYVERDHAHYTERDYSGAVGNLKVDWEITGKTRLAAMLARELASYQSISSSYTRTDRLSINPYWQVDAKFGLRLRYDYARREYLGAIAVTSANGRVDHLHYGQIALEWQPYRSLFISTALQTDRRTSNQPDQDYDSNMINISAQLDF